MDLLESHFATLRGNLYYNEASDSHEMFGGQGKGKHLNYVSFKELFKNMEGMKDPIILETGIASAGTYSTVLFNEYVRKYGGRFWSVDINRALVDHWESRMCPATTLIHADSAQFLEKWVADCPGQKADVVYLDSYDLDFYDPHPSGEHGLKEYNAIKPALGDGSLLLIDDTPVNPYWLDTRGKLYGDMKVYYEKNNKMPGKGMYVLDVAPRDKMLMHTYQVLYKF
jgi:hypothetical protein